MYKNIYKFMIALVVIAGTYSCKKDLGNYEYSEINKASIEPIGTNDKLTAIVGKRFIVKPVVTFTQDNGNDTTRYSYEWLYVGSNGLGGQGSYVMATTRYLDVNMTLPAATYAFYYGVTDKITGVKFRKGFSVEVKNEINEGWFLMTDVNGQARVDMLSKEETDFRTIQDLLTVTGSPLKLEGKPKFVYSYNSGIVTSGGVTVPYSIYFGTDKTTEKVEPETFKWTSYYNLKYEVFGSIPSNFYADLVTQAGGTGRSYMLGDGDVYMYERVQQIRYSVPINYIDAEKKEFKVAPFIAVSEAFASPGPGIFYDITNKRFVKHLGTATSCTLLPEPADAVKLFSYNNTGKDLLYMTFSKFGQGVVYAVLRDPANGKRYLARFNGNTTEQTYYAEITDPTFANAESYAVNPEFGYLFYSVGGKVYQYNLDYKTVKLVVDKGAEKVSLIKFHNFNNATKYPDGNKLIVCSYNPALPEGANGKMEQFTVPGLSADLVPYKSYSGFGKVVSLHYRER